MGKLTVINDLVLLKEEQAPDYNEYKGFDHIVIPDLFKHGPEDRPVWGTVVEKGDLCRCPWVAIGQRVLVGKWAGSRVTYDNVKYLLVREEEILAADVAKS